MDISIRPDVSSRLAGVGFVAVATLLLAASSASAGCPPTPRAPELCRGFDQSSLAMDAFGHFDWKGSRGSATSVAEFIDPSAQYQLCAWDEERLVVAADVIADAECRGTSCWTTHGAATRRYEDEVGNNGDVRYLEFHGSDTARTSLSATTFVIGGIILPVSGGVIVQLVRTDTETCLESFLPADSFTLDDKAAFSAKAVPEPSSAPRGYQRPADATDE